ncbi:MAG: hypothetical protein HKM94_08755 [Halobacteria archaeon]|nr:hypothetical protein [Halobacteria archaeon]
MLARHFQRRTHVNLLKPQTGYRDLMESMNLTDDDVYQMLRIYGTDLEEFNATQGFLRIFLETANEVYRLIDQREQLQRQTSLTFGSIQNIGSRYANKQYRKWLMR